MRQGPELGVELDPQLVRAVVPRPAQVQRKLGERLDSDILCPAHDELPPSVSSVRTAGRSRSPFRMWISRRGNAISILPATRAACTSTASWLKTESPSSKRAVQTRSSKFNALSANPVHNASGAGSASAF